MGGDGGSMGGGIGGKMGLEMETAIEALGMPRSTESLLTIEAGESVATRSIASAVPPSCVITMRAVTPCRLAERGDTLPPIVMPDA